MYEYLNVRFQQRLLSFFYNVTLTAVQKIFHLELVLEIRVLKTRIFRFNFCEITVFIIRWR